MKRKTNDGDLREDCLREDDEQTEEKDLKDGDMDEDLNMASQEIKAAIKYKLINNLYRSYLGQELPYKRVISRCDDRSKESGVDRVSLLKI